LIWSGTTFTIAVSISTIHHVLNLFADLLAGFSIAGLFVLLLLFRGERGAATAQTTRREE
jgi:hypothetical protein